MLGVLKTIAQSFISEVEDKFNLEGKISSFETHGNGNVNDTFLLFCQDGERMNRYTLQRINHMVFKNPEGLMENFSRVTNHLKSKISNVGPEQQCLSLIYCKNGFSFHKDSEGNYWRVTKFVDGGRSFEVPENSNQAYEAAKAFGNFQLKLSDLPGDPLIDTIPDFHNTRMRFQNFLCAVEKDNVNRVGEVEDLIKFASEREKLSDIIKAENFPLRVVHNDTKLNNVLLHKTTGRGMCVVDLDTVMSGCVLHDFGDLVRTAASSALEDEVNLEKVNFLPEIFSAIVQGYMESAGQMLEQVELDHMALAPQVITYELGLRFLTDYLEGDQYFKVKRPGHNLDRTRAQFKLLVSMEEQFNDMKRIVESFIPEKSFF